MSDLNHLEKRKLEQAFGMSSGYVLSFSNQTFSDFFLDVVGIDIYDEKYNQSGGSKANRMRAFWRIESNYLVGRILDAIFSNWREYNPIAESPFPPDDCVGIVNRLKEENPVPNLDALDVFSDEKTFAALARSIRESILRNEPQSGLDRLHTYTTHFFRGLCEKRQIATPKDKPLHSLAGEYVKALKNEGVLESEMTGRILKTSISVLESYNTVRNEQSFAHANDVLNYSESLVILDYITATIRFVNSVESNCNHQKSTEEVDDIPF